MPSYVNYCTDLKSEEGGAALPVCRAFSDGRRRTKAQLQAYTSLLNA